MAACCSLHPLWWTWCLMLLFTELMCSVKASTSLVWMLTQESTTYLNQRHGVPPHRCSQRWVTPENPLHIYVSVCKTVREVSGGEEEGQKAIDLVWSKAVTVFRGPISRGSIQLFPDGLHCLRCQYAGKKKKVKSNDTMVSPGVSLRYWNFVDKICGVLRLRSVSNQRG